MKRNLMMYATTLLIGGSMVFTSCKDEEAPVITLKGDSVQVVNLTEAADPGATANDDKDGDVSSAITSTYLTAVEKNNVGTYTATYTSSDESGNTTTKDRTVKVKGDYLAGSYNVNDVVTGSTSGSGTYTYTVTASASADTYNKLTLSDFGGFNATVYCTVEGTVVTIPSQNFSGVGVPAGTTISGTGTYDGAAKKFLTINYTGTNDVGNGTCTYTKQ
jgi:hypothetical protein